MVNFPKNTILEKKVPKQIFYNNTNVSSKVKKKFIEYVESIQIINKFARDTINLPNTENIEEIFIFQILLKDNKYLDSIDEILVLIDRIIPYPILFYFKLSNGTEVYKIAKKTRSKVDENKFVVDIYFTKVITIQDELIFQKQIDNLFKSINLEVFYNELLKIFLEKHNSTENIDKLIDKHKTKELLEKEISILEEKVIKEKQADKQFQLFNELKNKKKELQNE